MNKNSHGIDEVTIDWIAEALDARVVREVRSLTFGIASDMRLIEVDDRPLVLRRYGDENTRKAIADAIRNEVAALVAGRHVLGDLVPVPVADDSSGQRTGRPALLMTFLIGAPRVLDLDPFRMAQPLAALHASNRGLDLQRFRPWFRSEHVGVPPWTQRPDAWAILARAAREPQPESPHVFLHRDFHPGNLLWKDGNNLTGIVDWAAACRGPRGADLAHTRANLALTEGPDSAQRFLEAYVELVPSYTHDFWWDAAELFTWWAGDFSGVMAFNAFGATFSEAMLRRRADVYAAHIALSLPS